MKKIVLSTSLQKAVVNDKPKGSSEDSKSTEIYTDTNISVKIPIKYCGEIQDKRYNEFIIYEGYKPKNLQSMIDYMDFCLTFRKILPSKICSCESEQTTEDCKGNIIDCSENENYDNSSEISKELKQYYNIELKTSLPPQLNQEKILAFDSNFESGNLDRVTLSTLYDYNLFLKPDTNTRGHSQWFYFCVTNTYKDTKVNFNILNCTKPIELFKVGMRPLVFSEISYKEIKNKWTPDTFNISYYKNNILRNPNQTLLNNIQSYYTLSFSYIFKHAGDKVYFAYSYPYTLGMCFSLLNKIQQKFFENPDEVKLLQADKLQTQIKQYVNDSISKISDEKNRRKIKKCVTTKGASNDTTIHPYISSDVLKEYKSTGIRSFEWMKSKEFIAETQEIIYKQEVLCRTFSGIPIILLTITSPKYLFITTRRIK